MYARAVAGLTIDKGPSCGAKTRDVAGPDWGAPVAVVVPVALYPFLR